MNDGGYMAVSPHTSDVVFCTGNVYPSSEWNIAVSHTSDGGTTWEHDTLPFGSNGFSVAFDPFDANRVYVGGDTAYNYGNPQFLVSTDLGATWTPGHAGINGRIWALATDPATPGVLYCGTYQGVFKSTNHGTSWSGTGFTRDTRSIVIDPNHPATIFAGTYNDGVYASTDGGATWTAMNAGLTCNKILSLALRPGTENTLFAGTEGGSVFRTSLPTGISDNSSSGISHSSLVITPNPCYHATTVSYSHDLSPNSTLSIYDASGRNITTLPVSTSHFTLRTSQFPPGTYFVRLNSGRTTHTARLTVLD